MTKITVSIVVLSLLFFAGGIWAQPEEVEPIELNGTTWQIELRAGTTGASGRAEKDTIIFSDGKFSSQNFAALGFPAVGYSVRLGTDGSTIWETMQTKEEGGRLFWRGDIKPQTMQMSGILVKQSESGQNQDFNFVSQ